MLETSIVERLEKQLSAYNYQGEKIISFIRRHYTDILIIIPGNDSEKTNLEILKEISLCEETRRNNLLKSSSMSIETQDAEKQLQCFS